jgi:fructosamine-3-kinase
LAVRVKVKEGDFFIKWNQGDHTGMFETEARSLELLGSTGALSIPKVVNFGKIVDKDYLMLNSFQQPIVKMTFGRTSDAN